MSVPTNAESAPSGESRESARWMGFVVVAALIAFFVYSGMNRGQSAATRHPGVGQPLPELLLLPLLHTKKEIDAKSLLGKTTLVNFWGPWCPPCVQELPELLVLQQRFQDHERMQVLLVSCSQGPQEVDELRDETQGLLRDMFSEVPMYQDAGTQSRAAIVARAKMDGFPYPTTILLDGKGVIRAVWLGYLPHQVEEMGNLMEKIDAESMRETLAKKVAAGA